MHARTLVAGGVAAGLLALLPTTALADDAWFQDQRGDVASSVDVHRVRLINGTPDKPAVRVTVVQRELRAGDGFDVWYDTKPANPGPEYRATWFANSDSLGLSRVDSFSDLGIAVNCPAFRVRSAQDDPGNASRVLAPRGCLGDPGSVRISVRAQRTLAQHTVYDWAPSVLHFYPWVAQN